MAFLFTLFKIEGTKNEQKMAYDPNSVFLCAVDMKQAAMPSLPHPRMSVEMANWILFATHNWSGPRK